MTDFVMHPIGVIHSPFTMKDQTPIQASRSQAAGEVEVFPEFAPGLQDLDGFSHIILLYVWHEAQGFELLVKPFLDDQKHGVFATRYPGRPNQIGISIVRLRALRANIKPYLPDFDVRTETRHGWYETRKS
jgi:tRNA-Thr(GGU) m(6)t(6)A37 methyltransferase TsaA